MIPEVSLTTSSESCPQNALQMLETEAILMASWHTCLMMMPPKLWPIKMMGRC